MRDTANRCMLEKVSEYMERKPGLVAVVERLWAFIGGTCGLATACLVIFNYGAFTNTVKYLKESQAIMAIDVQRLKDSGSVMALTHIREDDTRDATMKARLDALEKAYQESIKLNTDIQVRIGQLTQKLDDWMVFQKKGP